LQTFIPPGLASHVQNWDPEALTFAPTGQRCKPFSFNEILKMNSEVQLGYSTWQVHAAPGHDPHSVVLFEPQSRTLISADALWENGFGVVFPELEGTAAFDEVSRTIDLIESLAPQLVIPGHGPVFSDVRGAIGVARRRLNDFVKNPAKHIHYASKVLLKFKLLEVQQIELQALLSWASSTYYFVLIHAKHFKDSEFDMWINQLLTDLANSKAIVCDGQLICNK
jgi:glyoxylase-like metal-dependent hydrolase (beta-lactamase superfamily II)